MLHDSYSQFARNRIHKNVDHLVFWQISLKAFLEPVELYYQVIMVTEVHYDLVQYWGQSGTT